MPRNIYGPEHEDFRASVSEFVERTLKPRAEQMLEVKSIDRDIWKEAGSQGLLGLDIPEEFGGMGAEAGEGRDGKRGQLVELEGSGSEAEVRAALERVRQQVSWLTASSSGIGQGTFSAQLRMVCTVPPRATPGICAAPSPTR